MLKKTRIILVVILIFFITPTYGCNAKTYSKWEDTLYTPTQITKIGENYFIIDCYHNRIIYNNNIKDDISKWKTLTDNINGGHSIASDGELYVHDDTENSSLKVFRKENETFVQTQIIENVSGRPHYVLYDNKTQRFYVISSEEGKIWVLENNNGTIKIDKTIIINDISNSYVRSFNIIDGFLYLISGNGYIYKVKYDDMSFDIIDKYEVPNNLTGMNFITKIEDYFYISTTQNSDGEVIPDFLRVKDLNDLAKGNYEDLYQKFNFKATPYFISNFDDKYYITEIGIQYNGVKSFEVKNNEITNIKDIYHYSETIKRE